MSFYINNKDGIYFIGLFNIVCLCLILPAMMTLAITHYHATLWIREMALPLASIDMFGLMSYLAIPRLKDIAHM